MSKPIHVVFVNRKIESEFESLKEGKFEDKNLYKFISKAINGLKQNLTYGIKIPKKLWPKEYTDIDNLWKYDLPKGWRLIYTIKTEEIMILNVILEWFDHKEYERRFKY